MAMIQQKLLKRLDHPDPMHRIRALHVIAMVEEIEALPKVRELFSNDPDPRVQKVAQWTGRLLDEAHKRGYSTEMGIRAHFGMVQAKASDAAHEQRLVQSLTMTPDPDDQDTRNQMELLQAEWQQFDVLYSEREGAAAPLPVPSLGAEHLDILDAGLSVEFRRYLQEDD